MEEGNCIITDHGHWSTTGYMCLRSWLIRPETCSESSSCMRFVNTRTVRRRRAPPTCCYDDDEYLSLYLISYISVWMFSCYQIQCQTVLSSCCPHIAASFNKLSSHTTKTCKSQISFLVYICEYNISIILIDTI